MTSLSNVQSRIPFFSVIESMDPNRGILHGPGGVLLTFLNQEEKPMKIKNMLNAILIMMKCGVLVYYTVYSV